MTDGRPPALREPPALKTQRDWPLAFAAVCGLALLVAWLRVPETDLPCLNPDEAQYLAFASYLGETGQSPFDRAILHPYTHLIYQQTAEHFGYYNMKPIRQLVMLLCGVSVLGIFLAAYRITGTLAAFLGSVFFLYESCYFEGFSANREWFSIPLILLGWHLYDRAPSTRYGTMLLILSGFTTGMACWFKEQFAPMSIAIAIDLVYRGCVMRDWRGTGKAVLAFASGGILSIVAFAAPMLLRGTFDQQWSWIVRVEFPYAGIQASEGITFDAHLLRLNLYNNVPFRLLILGSAFGGLLALGRILRSLGTTETTRVPKIISVCVFYLPLAAFSYQLGQHFHFHYYLFMLPAMSILLAYFIREALDTRPGDWSKIILLTTMAMIVTIDVTSIPSDWQIQTLATTGTSRLREFGGILAVAIGTLGLAAAAQYPPALLWTRLIQALAILPIFLELALLVALTHFTKDQVKLRGFSWTSVDRVSEWLKHNSGEDDRLFVWGWRPEIYDQSAIPAASAFCASLDLLQNTNHDLETGPNFYPPYAEDLLRDLEHTKPRWIVDAWLCSIFGGTFRTDYYPPLADYLALHYERIKTIDSCFVYERLPEPRSQPVDVLPMIEEASAELDRLLQLDPFSPMLRLTKGDILAQEGKWEEASSIYNGIEKDLPSWSIPRRRQKELQEIHGSTEASGAK